MYTDPMPATKKATASTGLNLFDLTGATPAQRTVIRILLRRINLTHRDLMADVQSLPEGSRLSEAEIVEALEALIQQKWLWKDGEGADTTYSVRLRKRVSRVRARVDLSQRHTSAFTQMWGLLEERALDETGSAATAVPTRPGVFVWIDQFIRERIGARQLIPILIFLLAANTFVLAILDVVAVSGFVTRLGTRNLPWLTISDMLIGLIASGTYLQFSDRIPRVRLMKILVGGLTLIYLIITGLFVIADQSAILGSLARALQMHSAVDLLFPLMYLLRAQQIILFPIAFWNLANSLYSMNEAKRVFPLLASGEMIGGLIGYSLFSLPPLIGSPIQFGVQNATPLLAVSAVLFLINLGLVQFGFKKRDDDVEEEEAEDIPSFRENLREGFEIIQHVPVFRYLAATVLLIWITFSIFGYHFYTALDQLGKQGRGFETLYSLYSIGTMFVPLILQWQVTPRLLKIIQTKEAFLVLPGTLMLGTGAAMIWPGAASTITAAFLTGGVLVPAWDTPALQTLKALIPEERRGRVSTLLSTYTYAAGQIVGSLLLGAILVLGPRLNAGLDLSLIYLPLAIAAAFGATLTAWFVRTSYESSLMSWRLSRRTRKSSVMDKLDF
jgi:hypothetical protein